MKLVGNSSRELTDIEGIFNIDNGVINISDGRSVNELYTLANELSGGGDILKGMAILADYLYEGYKLVDDAMLVSSGDPYIFTGALAVEAILTILNKSTGDTEPGYPGGAIMYEELGFQKRRDIKYVTTIAQILYIESNPMYRYLIDAKHLIEVRLFMS